MTPRGKDKAKASGASAADRTIEALQASEQRHLALLQTAMDGFWRVDRQGRLLQVNDAYCRMSGYSQQELLSMRVSDLEVNETATATVAHIRKVREQGEDRFESRHRRKDGRIFDVEVSVQRHPDEDGQMVTFLHDITERKQAEAALRESEDRYRGVFDNAIMGISHALPDGRLIRANQAYAEMYGYSSPAEMMAAVVNAGQLYVDPDDRKEVLRILNEKGFMAPREISVVRRDGARVVALVSARGIRDPAGKLLFYQAEHVDVTRLKLAEDALRSSEAEFRAMFETASIGMAQADPRTGQWVRVNQRMCVITGYSADELLRMRIAELTHPEDRQQDSEAFQRVVRGEAPDYHIEKRYLRKDGSVAWVNVNMTVIRDAAGHPVRTMATIEDITARKQAEAALVQKNAALRELVEQMGAEKGRIHDDIVANMEEVVIPLLDKLRLKGASRQYVKLLEHHLRDLTSPYARHVVTGKTRRLTPRETEICNMIKSGLPSKDIAEMLGVACQTVQRHRRNIRRRLGLTGKKQNLTSFLADT